MEFLKTFKLVNPMRYPWAILAGGIVLVGGIRVLGLPTVAVVPVSLAIAGSGAVVLGRGESGRVLIDDPILARELETARELAQSLAEKALVLQAEASQLLHGDAFKVDLLSAVEYASVRAQELPRSIEQMTHRFQGSDSLLSVGELEAQLSEVIHKQRKSTGATRQQLDLLANTLQRNIDLAKQGSDARQAQTIALVAAIQKSAGALQLLQNQMRVANFNDSEQLDQLRSLSADLKTMQENVDILVMR